jgi:hypothetical protein
LDLSAAWLEDLADEEVRAAAAAMAGWGTSNPLGGSIARGMRRLRRGQRVGEDEGTRVLGHWVRLA